MNINSAALGDPMYAFFRAVDAARQRNTVAFGQITPAARFDEAKKTTHKTVSSASMDQGKGLNTAHAKSLTQNSVSNPKPIKTRILGNFFDAYA